MAISYNRAIICGHVGSDPQEKGDRGSMVTMSVATSEKWKDRSGERQERTQWHKVVIFAEPVAKFVSQYVKKGDLVLVEGQIETRKWEKDGQDVYITEIVVRPYSGGVQLQSRGDGEHSRDDREHRPSSKEYGTRSQNFSRDLDDEIPF